MRFIFPRSLPCDPHTLLQCFNLIGEETFILLLKIVIKQQLLYHRHCDTSSQLFLFSMLGDKYLCGVKSGNRIRVINQLKSTFTNSNHGNRCAGVFSSRNKTSFVNFPGYYVLKYFHNYFCNLP